MYTEALEVVQSSFGTVFAIPESIAGGEYNITVSYVDAEVSIMMIMLTVGLHWHTAHHHNHAIYG